jgi:hypothetical protein
MKKLILLLSIACVALPTATLAETKWVDAGGAACPQTCSDQSMFAVGAGKYGGDANRYYVCAGEAQGLRPGYNLANASPGNACQIGFDSKETAFPIKKCLCADVNIKIE